MATKFLFLAFFSSMASLSALPLSLEQMSEQEKQACGIEKLSSEEKQALQSWLIKQEKPQTPQQQKNKLLHGEFTVKATQDLGRFITLENDVTYEIHSRSRKRTMAWKVGETVRLIEPIRRVSYKLENRTQKQTVSAKAAELPAPKDTPPKAEE